MLQFTLKLIIGNQISDELQKLADEGFGRYIDKTEMERDKILEQRKCFSAFVKNEIRDVESHFSEVSMKMIAVQKSMKQSISNLWTL